MLCYACCLSPAYGRRQRSVQKYQKHECFTSSQNNTPLPYTLVHLNVSQQDRDESPRRPKGVQIPTRCGEVSCLVPHTDVMGLHRKYLYVDHFFRTVGAPSALSGQGQQGETSVTPSHHFGFADALLSCWGQKPYSACHGECRQVVSARCRFSAVRCTHP